VILPIICGYLLAKQGEQTIRKGYGLDIRISPSRQVAKDGRNTFYLIFLALVVMKTEVDINTNTFQITGLPQSAFRREVWRANARQESLLFRYYRATTSPDSTGKIRSLAAASRPQTPTA
jgi:hypothetical protein